MVFLRQRWPHSRYETAAEDLEGSEGGRTLGLLVYLSVNMLYVSERCQRWLSEMTCKFSLENLKSIALLRMLRFDTVHLLPSFIDRLQGCR